MADKYRQAGVDIDAADEAVRRIRRHVVSTHTPGVTGAFGGFGGLFDLEAAGVGPGHLLVSGADGVGTKLKLAFATGVHDTVGIDCVAMCVNDILTLGARPLFFLDYLAVGKLEPGTVERVVKGVAEGCVMAGCTLLGGETAELPGFYAPGEYDLAGFAVGAIAREALVDGARIGRGDDVIALPSAGFHSNGFSLIRRVLLEEAGYALDDVVEPLNESLSSCLLRSTRIYVREVLDVLATPGRVRGMVHVTGGGLLENLPRVLPDGLGVAFDQDALDALRRPEFDLVRRVGRIPEREMYRVFNMGVGFVLIVEPSSTKSVLAELGDEARIVGRIVERTQLPGPGSVDIPKLSGKS